MRALERGSPLARALDQIPVPTREQNSALVARAQAGDATARDEAVLHNLRLAVSVAARYTCSTLTLADLVGAAVAGILRAIELFDPTRGSAFSTYATCWIRAQVTATRLREDALVRIPCHRRDRRPIVRFSLDGPVPQSPTLTLGDTVVDQRAEDPSAAAACADAAATLRDALSRLPERWRTVLEQRFGMRTGDPATLSNIGRQLGVSGERVRQIEAKGLARLSAALHAHGGADAFT